MALGCIPRFSPSFSPAEFRAAARALVRPPPDEPAVQAFEQTFATFVGTKHAVMVPSARFGFWLLLQAWGLGEGDEVVIPALTYFAIPGMAVTAGCTPVFADTQSTTCTLDPAAFEAAIGPNTRAVVPTHLFGVPCDMDPILAIARKHGLHVIEDCAQATGARYHGTRVGHLGDAAYYTFGLTKNITTLKGAMITTDDDAVASKVREQIARATPTASGALWREVFTGTAMMVATHPWVYPFSLHPVVRVGNALGKDPIHDRFAEPERIDDTVSKRFWESGPRAAQAAVGQEQLRRIEALNGARIKNGRFLDENLAHVPGLVRPTWPRDSEPIFMSYVVQHAKRDALAASLLRRGVDTTIGYMTDASTSPLFAKWARPCPAASESFRNLLHVPVHPNLSHGDLVHIAEAVRLAALEIDT
jgi:dTDP-4-amino-4,6-dideoxygalactose transaminase